MKRILILLLTVLILLPFSLTVYADYKYINDYAFLLSDEERVSIESKLKEISDRQGIDILILTLDSLDGYDPGEYANRYLDNMNYGKGKDALLLLVSMEDRDWYLLGNEYGAQVFDSDARSYMSDAFLPELSEGNYEAAFEIYADKADELIDMHKSGISYKLPFKWTRNILICLGIGLALALIITYIMKGQLKSVAFKPAATEYIRSGSMNVTKAYDLFLYSTVTRTAKPKSSSSSGASRSGGGGKF